MPCWLLRIAGLTLSICGNNRFGIAGGFDWDDSFGIDTGMPECVIRIRQGRPPRQVQPDTGNLEFSSASVWAAFRRKSGWTFVSPAPGAGEWQRLLFWSLRRSQADLWLNPSIVDHDPIQSLTLPFFTALFARHQGILVHAAAVVVDGRAWVFAGPSGTGKSHWTRHCLEQGITVLDEDRVVLRLLDGQVWAFGTPWHREPRLCSPQGAPVERLFFLQQAEPDAVLGVRPAAAATLLIRCTQLPVYDPQAMQAVLDVVGQAAVQTRLFLLGRATGDGLFDRLATL
jgi:hypothetical protein